MQTGPPLRMVYFFGTSGLEMGWKNKKDFRDSRDSKVKERKSMLAAL